MASKLSLFLGILNSLAALAVLGLFVYSKVLYKRPVMTESAERVKLQKKEKLAAPMVKALVQLEPVTSNLDLYKNEAGKEVAHLVSLTAVIEIRDEKEKERFEKVRPIFMDQLLEKLGHRTFQDLNQVQGRYLLRSELIESMNKIFGEPVLTEIYFLDFLLQ